MMEIILKLKGKEQSTVIMLLYLWWGERNKWREEGRRRTVADLAYIAAYQADLVHKSDQMRVPDFRQLTHWKKPGQGELKLNTDGAFDVLNKDGGSGFVIRNDQGRAICSGAGREDHLLDAFHAELKGCLAGLQEAVKLGVTKITLEVDATLVKGALESDDFFF
jgi:hypothetical protein